MRRHTSYFKRQKVCLRLLIWNTAEGISTLPLLLIIIWLCAFKNLACLMNVLFILKKLSVYLQVLDFLKMLLLHLD